MGESAGIKCGKKKNPQSSKDLLQGGAYLTTNGATTAQMVLGDIKQAAECELEASQ